MFQQIFGTAMESPVLVTVANLVMEDVEQWALTTYTSPPPFWKCYVDDTFTALPKEHVQFHDHFNSVEPRIKFRIELEQDGSLPFLDTKVRLHSDGSLTTTVFRKKTQYLDFNSLHPLAHKVAVTRTLLTRVDRICTNVPDRDTEKRQIIGALSSNSYPTGLVKRNWYSTTSPAPPIELDAPRATVVIPYIRYLSELIRCILAPFEIGTCFRQHYTLRKALVHFPLWWMPQVVRESDRQNLGPAAKGTQTGSNKWQPGTVSSG